MTILPNEDDIWLDRVRSGDFAAIPFDLTWLQSARLAHLINGYDASHALGLGDLHGWANERADEAARTGSWSGSALELWLCLFYEHRRWRHFGLEPEDADCDVIAQLWQQLRSQLKIIGDDERATILAQIAASTSKMR